MESSVRINIDDLPMTLRVAAHPHSSNPTENALIRALHAT